MTTMPRHRGSELSTIATAEWIIRMVTMKIGVESTPFSTCWVVGFHQTNTSKMLSRILNLQFHSTNQFTEIKSRISDCFFQRNGGT